MVIIVLIHPRNCSYAHGSHFTEEEIEASHKGLEILNQRTQNTLNAALTVSTQTCSIIPNQCSGAGRLWRQKVACHCPARGSIPKCTLQAHSTAN